MLPRLPRCVSVTIASLAPALVAVLLIEVAFGKTLRDTVPYIDDEVAYHLQVSAFARAGFSAGYFTINEIPAAASFTRFGPHGPAFAAIIGSIGRLTGVRPYSIALIGLGLVTVAAWIASSRLVLPSVAGALALGTFWPLILTIPTSMQESLHFAIGLLLASLIGVSIERDRWPRLTVAALLAIVCISAVLRPTWMFTLVGMAWIATRRTPFRLAGVAGAILLSAGAYALLQWFAAPFPRSQTAQLITAASDMARFADLLSDRVLGNVWNIFRHKDTAEALWHGEAILLIAACAWQWRVSAHRDSAADRRVAAASAFGALLLLSLMAAILAFYEVGSWRAVRVLASPMLLVLVVGLAAHAPWARWLLATHVLLAPFYLQAFVNLNEGRFAADRTRITYFRRQVQQSLQFEPDAAPWRNTVLVHVDAVNYALGGLPAGFGLSVALNWTELTLPVRSAHLLLRPEDRHAIGDSMQLEEVQRTVAGVLYRNMDAESTQTDRSSTRR